MDTTYQDPRVDDIEHQDGVVDSLPLLSLDLDDKDIIKNLNDRIDDSREYWNSKKGYNLAERRKMNKSYHLGEQIDKNQLYKFQTPYVENEIFVGVESIISYVCSQVPQDEVAPGDDTVQSKILAEDLAKYHAAHSQKFNTARIFEGSVRHLLIDRIGLIGLRYDPSYGKHGEIIPEIIDPAHVTIDKNARLGQNPLFINIDRSASVEQVCVRFPDARDKVWKHLGIQRGTKKQMSEQVVYHEVWFTDYSTGEPIEAVAWYMEDIVLFKSKDPNWDADDVDNNFLDNPMKPFIPINLINDGSSWIDQTTPIEQAGPIQDLLNKRGRQIMENADHANPKEIYSGDAISKDDVENITGDPNQRIVVDAPDVRTAVLQVQAQMLPSYVIADKTDLRNVLHAILGTPPQFTGSGGDGGGDKTLGQDLMQKNQASARQDQIVRAVEQGANMYFNLLTQMMKMYYDENHDVTIDGGDGEYDFISMHSNKIDPKASVMVRAGTSLPFDKQREQAVALNLSNQDKISPYDLYKMLDMPNPQKLYDNWMKYKTDPTSLSSEIDKDMANRSAYIEFVEIMDGRKVTAPDDVTPDHLMAHSRQLTSDEFTKSDTKKQRALIKLVTEENLSLKRRSEAEQLMEASIQSDTQPAQPQQPALAGAMPPQPGMPLQGMPGGMPGIGQPMPPPMPGMMPGQPMPQGAPPMGIGAVMNGAPIQAAPQMSSPASLPGV